MYSRSAFRKEPPFLPGSGASTFPQLNFRTYVQYDGCAGVYFLSSDAGSGIGASIGKRLLQVPIYRAEMKLRKRGEEYSFWSRRTDRDAPAARFGAEYRPVGETFHAEPGSIEEFLVERTRYFVPDGDERAATGPSLGGSAMQVGTLERDPWTLQDVEARIETNTLFQAAGVEPPTNSPLFHYSPSFELTSTPPRPQGRS